jgi:hypothetical protein
MGSHLILDRRSYFTFSQLPSGIEIINCTLQERKLLLGAELRLKPGASSSN